jgi:hypothetical protein
MPGVGARVVRRARRILGSSQQYTISVQIGNLRLDAVQNDIFMKLSWRLRRGGRTSSSSAPKLVASRLTDWKGCTLSLPVTLYQDGSGMWEAKELQLELVQESSRAGPFSLCSFTFDAATLADATRALSAPLVLRCPELKGMEGSAEIQVTFQLTPLGIPSSNSQSSDSIGQGIPKPLKTLASGDVTSDQLTPLSQSSPRTSGSFGAYGNFGPTSQLRHHVKGGTEPRRGSTGEVGVASREYTSLEFCTSSCVTLAYFLLPSHNSAPFSSAEMGRERIILQQRMKKLEDQVDDLLSENQALREELRISTLSLRQTTQRELALKHQAQASPAASPARSDSPGSKASAGTKDQLKVSHFPGIDFVVRAAH